MVKWDLKMSMNVFLQSHFNKIRHWQKGAKLLTSSFQDFSHNAQNENGQSARENHPHLVVVVPSMTAPPSPPPPPSPPLRRWGAGPSSCIKTALSRGMKQTDRPTDPNLVKKNNFSLEAFFLSLRAGQLGYLFILK